MLPIYLFSTFFLFITYLSSSLSQEVPSCLDEDGNQVDWFIAYKIPSLSDQPEPFNSGYAYAYITSENVKNVDPMSSAIKADADLDSVVFLNRFKNLLLKYLGLSNIFSGNKIHQNKMADHVKVSSNDNLYWTISAKLISDPDSIIMRTLEVAYSKDGARKSSNNKLNSIFYNDQPPQSSEDEDEKSNNYSRAHAKGVVLIDDVSGDGLWLTHSVS